MTRDRTAGSLRGWIALLALLAMTTWPGPDARAGVIEDLLKLKKAKEEAERQRREEQARRAAPPAPSPAPEPQGATSAQADASNCGPLGCGKAPDDPTPDLPRIELRLQQLATTCRKPVSKGQQEWSGFFRHVDLAEVLRRRPETVVLSAEEIDRARSAHRFATNDPDWSAIHNAASYLLRFRNSKGPSNGAWLLDASPGALQEPVPALYAFVIDPARLPDVLRATALTPVEEFLGRVHKARRDQQERQVCSAPPPVAASAPPIVALKVTPTWLNAAGEPVERAIEKKARPPEFKRLLSAGVFAIHPETGALSQLPPAGAGFNDAAYGGGGRTRAVLDPSGRVLFQSYVGALGGLSLTGAPPRTLPPLRTRLSLESQPVLHPKLNVLYLITGDYENKPSRFGISAFRFEPATGALAPVEGSSAPLGNLETQELPNFDIRIAPDGTAAYLYDGFQRLHAFRIDTGSGALSPVPGTPFATAAAAGRHDVLAVHPGSRHVWLALQAGGHQGFAVQPGTGVLVPMAPMPAGLASCLSRHKLVFDAAGAFAYATSQSAKVLVCSYAIDRATGALSALPPLASPRALSATLGPYLSPNGRFLYVENYDNMQQVAAAYEIIALALDPAGGTPRQVGTLRQNTSGEHAPGAGRCGTFRGRLVLDPTGEYLYGPEWSYQADPQTGVLTPQAHEPRDLKNCFVPAG